MRTLSPSQVSECDVMTAVQQVFGTNSTQPAFPHATPTLQHLHLVENYNGRCGERVVENDEALHQFCSL